jgi:hypothetical protein
MTIHGTNYVRLTTDNHMRAGAMIEEGRWWRRGVSEALEGKI